MKKYHGIIEHLHLIAQKQAELQNELHVEQKKRHQPYYCNLGRMISGGWILCNAIAVCELLADGKSQSERRFGWNPSDMLCSRGEFWEENILTAEIGKVRCIKNVSQKTECERSLDNPKI